MPENKPTLWNDESAATAVEYSLIIAAIAAVIIIVVFVLGDEVLGLFSTAQEGLETARGG